MIWILKNPECLRSVADRFNMTKSILFRVNRRICGAIARYFTYWQERLLLIWNWAPLGKMMNFGSFAQRNALDQWSDDPSLDHADQWSDESLSRVDLIDHWSDHWTPQIRNPDPDFPKGTHPRTPHESTSTNKAWLVSNFTHTKISKEKQQRDVVWAKASQAHVLIKSKRLIHKSVTCCVTRC